MYDIDRELNILKRKKDEIHYQNVNIKIDISVNSLKMVKTNTSIS